MLMKTFINVLFQINSVLMNVIFIKEIIIMFLEQHMIMISEDHVTLL